MATPTSRSPATGRAIYTETRATAFEDLTRTNLNVPGWSIGAAWLDYDRDGCVDLFVGAT
jgi:hypothetical protein